MKDIYAKINDDKVSVKINLIEVKNPYNYAQSIANLISSQLKKRVSSRLVLRNILNKLQFEREIKGIKLQIKGRVDGAEIAQTKKIVQGKMPLSTIDSNIDVGQSETITAYGKIGIQVLIYFGKI